MTIADARANEKDGTMTFTVRLDRPSAGLVTATYDAVDPAEERQPGVAEPGRDYRARAGTVVFMGTRAAEACRAAGLPGEECDRHGRDGAHVYRRAGR